MRTQGSPPSNVDVPPATSASSPRPPSAATVRKAIIQTLATGGPQTAKNIESAVGKLLPAAEKPSVKQQLEVLREGGYVHDTSHVRQLELTESGHRWWDGIQALTPRAA